MNGSTTPTTLYRFRSIDVLLDKYHELEEGTIYFASPEQLNDPMEGFRDIVWDGDKIVWTNFFKHYIYCLYVSYLQYTIVRDSVELDINSIPILGSWDKMPAPQMQRFFDGICRTFFDLPNMPEIIEALSNANHEIRYRELGVYLCSIHHVLLNEIEESFIEHGYMFKSARLQSPEGSPTVQEQLESILELIKQIDRVQDKEEIDAAFQFTEERRNELRVILQLENPNPTGILWKNIQLVICDFPMIYLNEIERLLWPNWYTACFMKDYRNSSVWGHYAGGHKGVCLVYESKQMGEFDGLELYYGAGNSTREIRLSEIIYKNKPAKVDFFRSIGRVTGKDAKEHWYADEEGNVSECAPHIPRDGDMDSDGMIDWRKRHRDTFYRDITVKTKHWEYEQECRLILEDGLRQFDEKESRKLRYDFNSLKGIIFGIKTSDDDRREIINIIRRKWKNHERTDFKFYQAYYSPETGDIQKY